MKPTDPILQTASLAAMFAVVAEYPWERAKRKAISYKPNAKAIRKAKKAKRKLKKKGRK
jgi:hypothetical protein